MAKYIECHCGCGTLIPAVDARGRKRYYVRGHSSRCVPSTVKRECLACGKVFIAKRGQKYCSAVCRYGVRYCACGCGKRIPYKSINKDRDVKYLPGHHWIGRKHTLDEKRKIGVAVSGERNGMWRGGIAYEPYAEAFVKHLRREVRKRFNHCCFLCGAGVSGRGSHVHHIDYDKMNTNIEDLVLLCRSCHGKTNTNREEWTAFFREALMPHSKEVIAHGHSG